MNTIKKISVSDASRNFSDFVNRVAYRGERFLLIKGNRAVAELSPVVSGRKMVDLPEILKSLPKLEENDDFLGDLNTLRKDMNKGGLRDPWES
jgi:antitoxin (DNA-binding transcriptional repressor) of toxin-antitoxin stability system